MLGIYKITLMGKVTVLLRVGQQASLLSQPFEVSGKIAEFEFGPSCLKVCVDVL